NANVSLQDWNNVKNSLGAAVSGFNFRYDLNHDGAITSADQDLLKPVFGSSVPGNPTDNTPPTLSTVADQTAFSGKATAAVGFSVNDAESAPSALGVSASPSDQALLPDSAITLGGAGSSRTISLTPASGLTGSLTITLTASDGLATAT